MQKRKFTAKEKTAITVLVILMLAVIGIGTFIIVNNVNEANREATNTSHTTVKVTVPPTEEAASEKEAEEKNAETAKKDTKSSKKSSASPAVKSNSKKSSAKASTSSKTKSKKSVKKHSKPKKPVNNNQISIVTPKNNTSHKSDKKCVINGVTCYVGDTISVTLNLKCAKTLVNFQGYSTFDTSYLKCTSVTANVGIANNKDDKIYYNASNISGLDFSSEGTIYTAKFTVQKAGSTSIKNTLQILTDMNDNEVSLSNAKDTIIVFS